MRRRSARSRVRWCEHEGSDVQEAREDPGRRDFQQKTEFQQKSVYRVQQKTAPQAFKEGSTKPWWNSETWGTPACTRETERLPQHAWMATAQQCKRRRRRWDTGGLTANNNHAGGVEGLRNDAVVESQRPKRERAQTANHVVVKYLDRRARALTANRRSRSGVGGARRGVRGYGAVNYHKSGGERAEKRDSSADQTERKQLLGTMLHEVVL